jgi:hypothetical protein
MFGEVPLRALEELIHFGSYSNNLMNSNPGLVENLRQNRPPLSTFFTAAWSQESAQYLDTIFDLPLRRIVVDVGVEVSPTRLWSIHFAELCNKYKVFANVEELVIEDCYPHSLGVNNDAWRGYTLNLMPALRKVELPKSAFAFFRGQTNLKNITHLTILASLRRKDVFDLKDAISFPSLKYLRLDGTWQKLVHFDAPKLIELILRAGMADLGHPVVWDDYWEFEPFSLFPEILHVDCPFTTPQIHQILEQNGKNLREIRITYVDRFCTLSEWLTQILCGGQTETTVTAPVCPLLWKIEIVTAQFYTKDLYDRTRRHLQQIIDARFPQGRFGKVRHGAYPVNSSGNWEIINVFCRRAIGVKWFEYL